MSKHSPFPEFYKKQGTLDGKDIAVADHYVRSEAWHIKDARLFQALCFALINSTDRYITYKL